MNYIKMLKHIYQLEGKKVEWGLIEEITYTKEKNIWGGDRAYWQTRRRV